jgi:hypothetical protein
MGHKTDKRLEHAEHTQHHAHDPFDSKVAMTMAILAAILAGVTLSSHRGHTETLRLATVATAKHTEATDTWNEYQAKNIRSYEFKSFLMLENLVAKDGIKQDADSVALRAYWISQVDKYEGKGAWAKFEGGVLKGKKEESKPASTSHEQTPEQAKEKPESKKAGQLGKLQEEATAFKETAKDYERESHELHDLVTWIDVGHLGLELALVFCAVSVLTKSRSFWLTGIVTGIIGSGIAGYGMVVWRFFLMSAGGGADHH